MGKTIPFLLLVLLAECMSSCHSDGQKPASPKAIEISAAIGGSGLFFDSIPVIHVAVTLYNPSADTLWYLTMTCSYEQMFTTSDSGYQVQSRWDCYSNYPIISALPPGTRTDRYIMIRKKNLADTSALPWLKIGMYNPPVDSIKNAQGLIEKYEKRSAGPVTWSNELDLQRLYRKVY